MTAAFRLRLVEVLPRLRRFALSLTGNLDQADDLVQEACVRALANASQWQPGTRLDSWMYRIIQNLWFDRLRAQKVRGEQVDVADVPGLSDSDGRDVVETRSVLAAVGRGMSKLPQEQQLVIGLVCIDGLSYKEAAEALGLPIGTVMSRLARARQALNLAMNGSAPPLPSSGAKRHG